jgi:digeranylgeranylglycerophospholipid reductase
MVVGDAAGQVEPFTGGGIHITAHCGRLAGETAADAIKNGNTSAEFLKTYEKRWKKEFGGDLKQSLKYRKIMDQLSDADMNILATFLRDQDLESISKLSMLKFIKEYPHFLKLLKEIL